MPSSPVLAAELVNSSVVLLTTLVFDGIARFVLLKRWLVNFFISQILPTHMDQFSPDKAGNKSFVTHQRDSLALMLTETIAR
jgi:hypothetical protein